MKSKDIWSRLSGRPAGRQILLMYHHICLPGIDPWEMCVETGRMKEQLEILSRSYTVRPLSGIAEDQATLSGKPVVYLTFDDGYQDNYENLYPLLQKFGIPATFFLPAKIFENDSIFWWEILEQVLLGTAETPEYLKLIFQDQEREWHFPGKNNLIENKLFRAWIPKVVNEYQKAYMELGEILKYLKPAEQESIKDQLITWIQGNCYSTRMNKLTLVQLKEMYLSGLIEWGGHTIHHPALGRLSSADQLYEIKESKTLLEGILSSKILSFAYPHGDLSDTTVKLVAKAGFDLACTTEEATCGFQPDLLRLPRCWVKNWDRKTFQAYLFQHLQG